MDRISYLPVTILHDILSWLPLKDAARTSILSKSWKDTWSTFPVLVFNDYNHGLTGLPEDCDDPRQKEDRVDPQQKEEHMRKETHFLNIVDNVLLRFHGQGLAIKVFKFSISSIIYKSLFPHFDHWLQLACKSGVEVLNLDYNYEFVNHMDDCYCLPPIVLGVISLTKLVLCGCIRIDQALLNHPSNSSSLKSISLIDVPLDDEEIQKLISICPLIEYLTLHHCDWLKSLRVQGLPKLKGVEVSGDEIAEIVIDAPSLEYFHCDIGGSSDFPPYIPRKINVDKCRDLRGLRLQSVRTTVITDQWFIQLFQKFLLLERLELNDCSWSESVKISSDKLKVLELTDCHNLRKVYVDNPNLYSCKYCGYTKTRISFVDSSSQLKFIVFLTFKAVLVATWIREFLQNINPSGVLSSLSLNITNANTHFCSPQDFPVSPPRIKHLKLSVILLVEAFCSPLVTYLFWICHPDIISLSPRTCNKTFIKLLCEKLTELMDLQEDGQCCSSSPIKCWRHGLKSVKVSCSSKTYDYVIDYKNLSDVLQTQDNLSFEERIESPLEHIDFMLEWEP